MKQMVINIKCEVCKADKFVSIPRATTYEEAWSYFQKELKQLLDHTIKHSVENNFIPRNKECEGTWEVSQCDQDK